MSDQSVLPRRGLGIIVINYDPNTQNVGLKVEGLTPIETTGLLGWCQHLFLASNKVGYQDEQQRVVPATVVPHA